MQVKTVSAIFLIGAMPSFALAGQLISGPGSAVYYKYQNAVTTPPTTFNQTFYYRFGDPITPIDPVASSQDTANQKVAGNILSPSWFVSDSNNIPSSWTLGNYHALSASSFPSLAGNPSSWQVSDSQHLVAYLADSGWLNSPSTPSDTGVFNFLQKPTGYCVYNSAPVESDFLLSSLPNLTLTRTPSANSNPSYTFAPADSSQGTGSKLVGSNFETSRQLYDPNASTSSNIGAIRHLYLDLTVQLINQSIVPSCASQGGQDNVGYVVTLVLVNYVSQQTLFAGTKLGDASGNNVQAYWYNTGTNSFGVTQNLAGWNSSPLSCGSPPPALVATQNVTSPQAPITYNLDLYCPISTLITNAPNGATGRVAGMDTTLSHWYVHSTYFGHVLFGGATANTRWGNFSLSASTAN